MSCVADVTRVTSIVAPPPRARARRAAGAPAAPPPPPPHTHTHALPDPVLCEEADSLESVDHFIDKEVEAGNGRWCYNTGSAPQHVAQSARAGERAVDVSGQGSLVVFSSLERANEQAAKVWRDMQVGAAAQQLPCRARGQGCVPLRCCRCPRHGPCLCSTNSPTPSAPLRSVTTPPAGGASGRRRWVAVRLVGWAEGRRCCPFHQHGFPSLQPCCRLRGAHA
jgi:hypothetical protein